jgi:bifunctional NMN adenylyltransferase/nudix hydrolase
MGESNNESWGPAGWKHRVRKTEVPKRSGVGVVIGRFQTPVLHNGHLEVLNQASKHNKMLVLLGVNAIPGAYKQELDFETRYLMISRKYPNAIIQPVHDMPSNARWSAALDSRISKAFPFSKVTIYHGRMSFVPYYEGKLEDRLKDVGNVDNLSATDLREVAYEEALPTEDFRRGVFYGLKNKFPIVSPTVDIAITRRMPRYTAINPDSTEELFVLMGKKADGRGWRFPGGFVDTKDARAEDAAIREAHEETGLLVSEATYVSSRSVNDWRNTERNTVLTTFYHFPYEQGKAIAGDDLCEVKWIRVLELNCEDIVKVHQPLVEDLIKFLSKGGMLP